MLGRIVFGAFLFWVIAGLIFTCLPTAPQQVEHWPIPVFLQSFVKLCLAIGDPLLILLAFCNSHLVAWKYWGDKSARFWGGCVLVISAVVETLGVETGWIFGKYTYTTHFGPMLGVIPAVIPMAWHVVLTQSVFIVRSLAPQARRGVQTALSATLVTAYDGVLEPFATQVKGYWFWDHGTVPIQNYVAWWAMSYLLIHFLAPVESKRLKSDLRPWGIIGGTLLIFLVGRWMRGV